MYQVHYALCIMHHTCASKLKAQSPKLALAPWHLSHHVQYPVPFYNCILYIYYTIYCLHFTIVFHILPRSIFRHFLCLLALLPFLVQLLVLC